ncbi:hypothetical protein LTR56_002755 [Elasticomyces elasticus]|nr:hypothetical protein LTR56_002755 [Elasticomyces elasticus]KAK3666788.1 hypothetical protein LTR22_002375 [Elasticomyces elasticus]KAK4918812.1 hypothetical protein LTR49_013443 [Elasticomyces elasticus]KAK5758729.1 hypothetical protein LTS12_011123 [Elasticomyces elasticus]
MTPTLSELSAQPSSNSHASHVLADSETQNHRASMLDNINGVPIEAILQPYEYKPELVERIAHHPQWLDHFQTLKSRILAAFKETTNEGTADSVTILSVNHIGSTSVPNLPAKAVIDIDLVLSSNALPSEPFYVPRLEAAGFQYLFREPGWHEHRFFCASEPMSCNLHVFGPQCSEVERHRIFRDWLKEHRDDLELYARTKKECAALSREKGEIMVDYTLRKEDVINQILTRAFEALGIVPG